MFVYVLNKVLFTKVILTNFTSCSVVFVQGSLQQESFPKETNRFSFNPPTVGCPLLFDVELIRLVE